MKNTFIFLCVLLLTACGEMFQVTIQIDPYVCVSGYQWTLDGVAIVDNIGAQLTCESPVITD